MLTAIRNWWVERKSRAAMEAVSTELLAFFQPLIFITPEGIFPFPLALDPYFIGFIEGYANSSLTTRHHLSGEFLNLATGGVVFSVFGISDNAERSVAYMHLKVFDSRYSGAEYDSGCDAGAQLFQQVKAKNSTDKVAYSDLVSHLLTSHLPFVALDLGDDDPRHMDVEALLEDYLRGVMETIPDESKPAVAKALARL